MHTEKILKEIKDLSTEIDELTRKRESLIDTLTVNNGLDNGVKNVTWEYGSWIWEYGSWEDVTNMLNVHYAGLIDITKYWKTGDTRRIQLSTGESLELVLIGNNHDDLVKPINGVSKAAFTVQTKICEISEMFTDYKGPQYSLWSESLIREYLNNKFKSSLPSALQSLIKRVKKETFRHGFKGDVGEFYRTAIVTQDDIFLLSETEVFGAQNLGPDCGYGADGIQYTYYKNPYNRIHYYPENKHVFIDPSWWLRSSNVNHKGESSFRIVSNGSVGGIMASNVNRLAPAFCI